MQRTNDHQIATFTHLSALLQYLIPFGNFIFPIVIWTSNRERSEYADRQGKECINFQLSTFIYILICAVIAIPIFIVTAMSDEQANRHVNHLHFSHFEFSASEFGTPLIIAFVLVILAGLVKVAEFLLTIHAALKTANGEEFRYPATIRFLK